MTAPALNIIGAELGMTTELVNKLSLPIFLRETYTPVLLRWRKETLIKKTRNMDIHTDRLWGRRRVLQKAKHGHGKTDTDAFYTAHCPSVGCVCHVLVWNFVSRAVDIHDALDGEIWHKFEHGRVMLYRCWIVIESRLSSLRRVAGFCIRPTGEKKNTT